MKRKEMSGEAERQWTRACVSTAGGEKLRSIVNSVLGGRQQARVLAIAATPGITDEEALVYGIGFPLRL